MFIPFGIKLNWWTINIIHRLLSTSCFLKSWHFGCCNLCFYSGTCCSYNNPVISNRPRQTPGERHNHWNTLTIGTTQRWTLGRIHQCIIIIISHLRNLDKIKVIITKVSKFFQISFRVQKIRSKNQLTFIKIMDRLGLCFFFFCFVLFFCFALFWFLNERSKKRYTSENLPKLKIKLRSSRVSLTTVYWVKVETPGMHKGFNHLRRTRSKTKESFEKDANQLRKRGKYGVRERTREWKYQNNSPFCHLFIYSFIYVFILLFYLFILSIHSILFYFLFFIFVFPSLYWFCPGKQCLRSHSLFSWKFPVCGIRGEEEKRTIFKYVDTGGIFNSNNSTKFTLNFVY